MNLYRITFTHYAPKDSKRGIITYILANSDEDVYNWIASEPSSENFCSLFNSWKDLEQYKFNKESECFINDDEDEQYWTNENGEPEDWKTKMIRLKGEENYEDVDFSDTYYGLTLYGWELVKENVTSDYKELIELGVIAKGSVKE